MDIRRLTSSADLLAYDAWMKAHPEGSLWQSLEWKAYQESLGREVRIYASGNEKIEASALVVIDRTSFGLSTWEIGRGPLWNREYGIGNMELLKKIYSDSHATKCMSLYLSPVSKIPHSTFHIQHSSRFVMPEATRILDLTLDEEALLNQMKPKGRYNIRLAEKHGVRIEQSDDVEAYATLAKQTWARDGFRGPGKRAYEHFLKDLPGSFLLLAYAPSSTTSSSPSIPSLSSRKPIAGLLGVTWGSAGIYYYGASSNAHRELMAPYLLQWEAMKLCRSKGCIQYDLFGIAPEGATDHPWSGVSDFKAKFGGNVVNYLPEQEITLKPLTKNLLNIKRKLIG